MGERRYEVTRSRVFRAPRDLVWALVADTNRWDRASNLTPGRYEWRLVNGVRVRAATASELGFAIEWIEPPYQWIEGRYIHGERRFLKGPVELGGFQARLEDVEGGTEVTATAYITGRNPLLVAAGPVQKRRFATSLDRFMNAVDGVLTRQETEGASQEPAVVRVRRALMGEYDAVASGERTDSNVTELELRLRRLSQEAVESSLVDRIGGLLRERPDEELAQIRPFELSRVWSADRREVLRAFLYATRAGLLDLRWQVNCPVCRVSAGVEEHLYQVRNAVHCDACNIRYDVDFGRHVEAVFQSNAAIRAVHPTVYCASSPSFLPHVVSQLTVPAAGELEERADLYAGHFHVRSLRDPRAAKVELTGGQGVRIVVTADALELSPTSDGAAIVVVNNADDEVTLLVERADWSADAVLGSVVASFPEFLDLFATEAPASGVELSVGEMTLLFSDLTGSTAMYERMGDARAFAVVEEHFRRSEEAIRLHEGAVVKTMGDAIMATFASPVLAVRAAIDMVDNNRKSFDTNNLSMRIGIHAGPCLAVRANDRLDFFGTTVNVASRLEHSSTPGCLVLTEDLSKHPSIEEILMARPRETFAAELKGIEKTQRLVKVKLRDLAEATAHVADSRAVAE